MEVAGERLGARGAPTAGAAAAGAVAAGAAAAGAADEWIDNRREQERECAWQ